MNENEIHVGDYGTVIYLLIYDRGKAVDVSGATVKEFYFEKPSGTTFKVDASFTTDGTDGLVEYTIQDGDIDESGIWKIQASLTSTTGHWGSDVIEFPVEGNIQEPPE